MSNLVIEARKLAKTYGHFKALDAVDIDIPLGRIVGVIGANGAGKTTLLNAILGLSSFDGHLRVLGQNPSVNRAALMRDVCFIADVATLPKWMRVREVLDFVDDIHPGFDRNKAMDFLSRGEVPLDRKVRKLSKGMTVQVHLAVVMAIDAKLLVLDEPTLGLDIIFRKFFYRTLLEDYFNENRTILITTHQVEEIEHILSDVIFIRKGRIALASDMDSLGDRFVEVMVAADRVAQAEALKPIMRGASFGKSTFIYRDPDMAAVEALGETRRLGLADIAVATIGGEH